MSLRTLLTISMIGTFVAADGIALIIHHPDICIGLGVGLFICSSFQTIEEMLSEKRP